MVRDLGADLAGGSTIPEIMTTHLLGLDHVAYGCCSNPGSGIESGFMHD